MNKFLYVSIALFFLSFQHVNLKNYIIGEWEVKDVKKKDMEVKPFKKTRDIALNTSYIFTEYGAVIINGPNHVNTNGTYQIKNDSLFLKYILTDNKVTEKFRIIKYREESIILEQNFKDWGIIQTTLQKTQR